jgi:hypothetical protein
MPTLAELEAAVDQLSPEQKRELFLSLAARLRVGSAALPTPRDFSRAQIESWIADDEEGIRRFRTGR